MIQPRPYQQEGIDACVQFLKSPSKKNGLGIFPTGSGKSVIIANVIKELGEPTLILQPSKEILQQNYDKYTGYGYDAGIYSASFNRKEIHDSTFATIGSIIRKKEDFKHFKYVLVDEAHGINSKGGMYEEFLNGLGSKVLGVTATPYRLSSSSFGAMLKFLTRTNPRIFHEVVHVVQNKDLFDAGYLAKLKYFDMPGFERSKIKLNSAGTEFSDDSLRNYIQSTDFIPRLFKYVSRLQETRKSILVFTRFIEESLALQRNVPGVEIITGETPGKLRTELVTAFRNKEIKTLTNVGVLTTGADFPELDTVVIARATKSLSLYYQMVGRAMRIHPDKAESFIIDMCSSVSSFGKVEDFHIGHNPKGLWELTNGTKPLTNVYF